MKILHISRTMGQGGAEKIVYQLCKSNEIDKVIASTGGYYADLLESEGINHYIIPDIDKKNPFLIIKTLMILLKIVKKEDINIIHSHHRMAAFYARILSFFYRKLKLIYTAHNVFYNKRGLMRFSLKNTTIVAVGKGVYNNLINYYCLDKKNIKIIYNSIEPNITGKGNQILNELKGKILIGNIGRLSEQKGIDIFLKAMKTIISNNKKVCAIIIGDGENREKYEKLAKDLEIEKNTYFLGFQNNVFDIIKQLDFVVLSSRWEGFPLTPIETFSMKKTIVASNIDGNNEIVKNNYNGLLFKKESINDLVNKILFLLKNEKQKKEYEKNGYKDFVEKYTYEVFINSYIKTYKRM